MLPLTWCFTPSLRFLSMMFAIPMPPVMGERTLARAVLSADEADAKQMLRYLGLQRGSFADVHRIRFMVAPIGCRIAACARRCDSRSDKRADRTRQRTPGTAI